ncbi:helix-turn-helix domain-containing protein [Phaeodactylibacter luteus]|nr:helix-turn-helix transcriptional regulator [Phaeodactylibacter luteus]
MQSLRTLNIEELRCNAFAQDGQQFDMCRLEDFLQESAMGSHVHRHNYYMLMYVCRGQGQQLIDFAHHDVLPGRFFLMYPGQVHAWGSHDGLEGHLIFFTPAFFTERYNNNNLREFPFFNTSHFLPYIDLSAPQAASFGYLLEAMLKEYHAKEEDYLKTLRSFLNILLYQCKRFYFERAQASLPANDRTAVLIVRRFEQLIEEQFREKRLVRDYAQLLLLTPNYLNAICSRVVGKSAGELIRERVMLEAKRLLLHDGRTVAEIGASLNFDDNSYFGRFFKKYEGLSPEQFRKSIHQNHSG